MHADRFGQKVRQPGLRWFGLVKRRDDDYVCAERCWRCRVSRKTKVGKQKMNVVKEDMQEVGAREDEVFDRSVWRIRCGDP